MNGSKTSKENKDINLSGFLKEHRLNANLTQHQLAEKLETNYSLIQKWEYGIVTPKLSSLMKLSSILNFTFEELYNYIIENKLI